jgi:hypothetical protein
MYTSDKHDKFIELRAQGWSLGHIANELYVSKRTLVDWNGEFATQIQAMRALELEMLKEKVTASRDEEVNRLTRLQKDIADELSNRTLKYLDTDKLFRLSVDLRQEIKRILQDQDSDSEARGAANGRPNGMWTATNGKNQP